MTLDNLMQLDKALLGPGASAEEAKAEAVLVKERWGAADINTENQLLVQVLAARGLRGSDLAGNANPYAIVWLKVRAS